MSRTDRLRAQNRSNASSNRKLNPGRFCTPYDSSLRLAFLCARKQRFEPSVYVLRLEIRARVVERAPDAGANGGKPLGMIALPGTDRLPQHLLHQVATNSDAGSTFTPGPMLDDTATRWMKVPLAPVGFAFCTASAKALMFSTSFWASNEDLPTPA